MATPYALVIEDNPQVAAIFHRAVEEAGFQAEIMDNGHKAQATLVFNTPDLILLDMHLPSLEGSVLLRQIRSQARFLHTRVVLISGDPQAVAQYSDLADAVLVKPVGLDEVRRVAEQLIPISIDN